MVRRGGDGIIYKREKNFTRVSSVLEETQEHSGFIFQFSSLIDLAILKLFVLGLKVADLILEGGSLILGGLERSSGFSNFFLMLFSVVEDVALLLLDLALNSLNGFDQLFLVSADLLFSGFDRFVDLGDILVNLLILLNKLSLLFSETGNLVSQDIESVHFGKDL